MTRSLENVRIVGGFELPDPLVALSIRIVNWWANPAVPHRLYRKLYRKWPPILESDRTRSLTRFAMTTSMTPPLQQ